jgi:hypothetical protein
VGYPGVQNEWLRLVEDGTMYHATCVAAYNINDGYPMTSCDSSTYVCAGDEFTGENTVGNLFNQGQKLVQALTGEIDIHPDCPSENNIGKSFIY